MAVAALVVALVWLLAGGSPAPRHRDGDPIRWDSRALPEVAALVGDLATLQTDTTGASDAGGRTLSGDTLQLERDVAAARAIPTPTTRSLAEQWSAVLGQLDVVISDSENLESAAGRTPGGDPGVPARVQAAISQAAQSLLGLAAAARG